MEPASAISTPIGPREVDEILALENFVLRNMWITQAYHEFAVSLAKLLRRDLTWCAFATWASLSAGSAIRMTQLPERVRRVLEQSRDYGSLMRDANTRLRKRFRGLAHDVLDHEVVVRALSAVAHDVSLAIAAGNALVFAELGPIFVRMIELYAQGRPDPAWPTRLTSAFVGGPDADSIACAFGHYRDAIDHADGAAKAQLVFLGNLEAVLHEQQRLQDAVSQAMDAPIRECLHGHVARHVDAQPAGGNTTDSIENHVGALSRHVEAIWEREMTEHMLKLTTGDETLRLTADVPPLGGDVFPSDLATIDHPELAALCETWDATAGTGRPSAAKDWARLEQRMNFILNLFRSRQQHDRLLDRPFESDVLADMSAGKIRDIRF